MKKYQHVLDAARGLGVIGSIVILAVLNGQPGILNEYFGAAQFLCAIWAIVETVSITDACVHDFRMKRERTVADDRRI